MMENFNVNTKPSPIKAKIALIQHEANVLIKKTKNEYAGYNYNKESQILELVKHYFKKYKLGYLIDYGLPQLHDNLIIWPATLLIYSNVNQDDNMRPLVLNDYFVQDLRMKMNYSQGFGSAKTYGIKYMFGKLFGIADDEIDPDSLKSDQANKIKSKKKPTVISDEIKAYMADLKTLILPEIFTPLFLWVKKIKPQTIAEVDNALSKISADYDKKRNKNV